MFPIERQRAQTPGRAGLSALSALALGLAACTGVAPVDSPPATLGPTPQLPGPAPQTVPTLKVAKPQPWAADQVPQPAPGLAVTAFARDLKHPRWLLVLPDGDVLVAESDAPRSEPPPPKGVVERVQRWAMGLVMRFVGARGESADRITRLRDADGDGVAETRSVLLEGLTSPFGMALVQGTLYVANADAVVQVPYAPDAQGRIRATPQRLVALPAGRNHHWTKNVWPSPDGATLYVTVGSNSNIAENGLAEEEGRAAVWAVDRATGKARVFASGLRNPNGLAWEPQTQRLWTVVNERDLLGNDLVPDYLTAIGDGDFFGWPWSYWGQQVDARVQPANPAAVARARAPDYALGAHVAALGLAWRPANPAWPQPLAGSAMVIGLHGSWNRNPPVGYRVVQVPFADGRPAGLPQTLLEGFVTPEGRARGRPVGVAVDARGGVLVADDVGGAVWRVTAAR